MTRIPTPSLCQHARRQAGITLIECAITLCVLATAAGVALPSFQNARELRHLEGAAAQLETDIQQSRSLAVARNETVRMSFSAVTGTTCYVVHTGQAGDCSCSTDGQAVCQPGAEALRSVRFGSELPLRVVSNTSSIVFDPVKGTITPTATLKVQAASGKAIHQVVNVMGRVRSCAPAPGLAGYKTC